MMALRCIPGMRPPSPFIFGRTFARVVGPHCRRSNHARHSHAKKHCAFRYRAARPADGRSRDSTCWSRPRSTMFNICLAAIARSSSTTWMRSGSAVTCRYLFIRRVTRRRPPISATAWRRIRPQLKPFWVSEVNTKSGGSVDVMQKAADYVRGLTTKPQRIGVELAFMPADSDGDAAQSGSRRRAQGCAVRARAIAAAQDRRRNWKSCGSRPSS